MMTKAFDEQILEAAVEAAVNNWAVLILKGKVPAIRGGRGVLDATTDVAQIRALLRRYRGANIGVRIPGSMFVLDVDPRHGGDRSIAELEDTYGEPMPETMQQFSGRGDGGCHYFYRRPPGRLSSKRLGPGLDIKTSSGYVVWAPSLHPATGLPYTRINRPIVAPPAWLAGLLLPEPKPVPRLRPAPRIGVFTGPSIADQYSDSASWTDILEPHGWGCDDSDPDSDGAVWLHPNATSACSATVKHGCLFVYSPNTPFDITEQDHPRGYTKFRAYAVLNHRGDLAAATRALKEVHPDG